MQGTLYIALLPIGFGIITLVLGLICVIGYLTSDEVDTKLKLYPWIGRFLLTAFALLSVGIFFTTQHFY